MQPSKKWAELLGQRTSDTPPAGKKPAGNELTGDAGTASLEFITAGMILLVPLVYLVLALAAIQAGAFAVEGAARQAARVYVQAGTMVDAEERAARAVEFALADHGVSAADASVTVSCQPSPEQCLTRLGRVSVTVRVQVTLPLVPDVLTLSQAARVPIEATATQQVSRFWRQP
ncbi:hypothetical protein [Homoserinimonas sp. OAct 916]|uniref:hypothetical protein n=1 Tax=Homoserinimonas sp. OAct 916 TaxID=2211450 RepID=UPI001E3F5B58|nr:hypothetical protein [Homoserinimonas sp. OAct 916]